MYLQADVTLISWHCKEGRCRKITDEFTWDVITDMIHLNEAYVQPMELLWGWLGLVWMIVQWRCCGDVFHLSRLLSDHGYCGSCTFCFIFIIILFLNALLVCQSHGFDAWADICKPSKHLPVHKSRCNLLVTFVNGFVTYNLV